MKDIQSGIKKVMEGEMTYDKLVAMATDEDGDTIIDIDRPGSYSVTPDGLYIVGEVDDGEAMSMDFLIKIADGKFTILVKDPEGTSDPLFGDEWTNERSFGFDQYEDMVHWIYGF